MVDVLFLDKDGTLYDDHNSHDLFPGVKRFLETQKAAARKLYIATGSNEESKIHLFDVESLLDGYLGREQLDSARATRYVSADGMVHLVKDDYEHREVFLSEPRKEKLEGMRRRRSARLDALPSGSEERESLQNRINSHFDYWQKPLHNQTREPFDPTTRYEHPHNKPGFLKDLHLARRLVAPQGYADLRTVMVGDPADKTTVSSDPETPLIIISNTVRQGNWGIVSCAIDYLFSSPELKPFQVYDAASESARQYGKRRVTELAGMNFPLERDIRGERFMYCP